MKALLLLILNPWPVHIQTKTSAPLPQAAGDGRRALGLRHGKQNDWLQKNDHKLWCDLRGALYITNPKVFWLSCIVIEVKVNMWTKRGVCISFFRVFIGCFLLYRVVLILPPVGPLRLSPAVQDVSGRSGVCVCVMGWNKTRLLRGENYKKSLLPLIHCWIGATKTQLTQIYSANMDYTFYNANMDYLHGLYNCLSVRVTYMKLLLYIIYTWIMA